MGVVPATAHSYFALSIVAMDVKLCDVRIRDHDIPDNAIQVVSCGDELAKRSGDAHVAQNLERRRYH